MVYIRIDRAVRKGCPHSAGVTMDIVFMYSTVTLSAVQSAYCTLYFALGSPSPVPEGLKTILFTDDTCKVDSSMLHLSLLEGAAVYTTG